MNLIQQLKDDTPKQETAVPVKPFSSMPQVKKYLRFKALHSENNPTPHSSTQDKLKQLGKELFQGKNFMDKIKLPEQNEAKKIERIVQEKQRSFERNKLIRVTHQLRNLFKELDHDALRTEDQILNDGPGEQEWDLRPKSME